MAYDDPTPIRAFLGQYVKSRNLRSQLCAAGLVDYQLSSES